MSTKELVLVFAILVIMFAGIFTVVPRHGVVVYDCSIAEISPDYPPSVKEECRRARMEHIKK
jgi:branched-subunit amino acid permease